MTPTHIREAKAGTSDDADAVKILEKAAKEGLSQKQTRTVAEEYKKAKQFSTKSASAVLRTPFEELGLRQFVPTTKPTRTVARTVSPPAKKTKAFSWVRDPNIIKAGELLKGMQVTIGDINSIVNFIEVNKEREPKQLPHIKKQLTAHLSKRIGEMKDIIARLEEI